MIEELRMRTIHRPARSVVVMTVLLVMVGWRAERCSAADGPARPNFVFFLVDDLGWADVGCYGSEFHDTPNIDRLAKQGMRFTSAYAACPVCSPTRASILSGKYPAHVNLTDFIPGHWRPWAKLVVPEFEQQLPLAEVTLAEALKAGGYAAASFGKWHLGGRDFHPGKHGFDDWMVTTGRHYGFRMQPDAPKREGEYLADRLTEESERFIEANKDRPFFLYLSHYAVHIPLQAPKPLVDKYEKREGPPGRPNNPIYAAMVESIDRSVGRIMNKLGETGLAERTVFVFFSDNGGLVQRYDGAGPVVSTNAPLRAEKGTLYEGGIREPLIVRWPGVVKPGGECDTPVTSVDFYPTFLDIAGLVGAPRQRLDGASLVPLLEQTVDLERDAIFWHYPHYHHCAPCGAVRSGSYKLIEYYEDGKVELYDLDADLGETTNLAEAKPAKAKELAAKLADWRGSVHANMPTENPDHDPEKAYQWRRRRRKAR